MKYLTQYVPQGSGISDGWYVAIEEAGVLKAQKLTFDGTTATPDGTAEVIDNVGLFATGMDEPAYEGSGGGSTEKPEKEMPTDGLVLYESFASDVGSFTVRSGSPVFTRIDNIQCMLVNPSICTLYKDSTGLPSGGASRSISTFIRFNNLTSNVFGFYVAYGGTDSNVFSVGTQNGYFVVYRKGAPKTEFKCEVNKWYHVCVTYENGFVQLFVDGNMVYLNNYTYDTETGSSYPVGIGWLPTQNNNFNADGYISGVRIYNRALTVDEITLLASEFDEDPPSNNACVSTYYKCTSVDTTAKTWSGYELVLQDGVYSVSDVATEGLSYSAVTPVVGNTYSADALITVRYANGLLPEDGLVFRASLNGVTPDVAETGQTLTNVGNPTYDIVDGVPCVVLDGTKYISLQPNILSSIVSDFTESIWLHPETSSNEYMLAVTTGEDKSAAYFTIGIFNNGVYYTGGQGLWELTTATSSGFNKWVHICITKKGTTWSIYVNGVKSNTITKDILPDYTKSRYIGHTFYTEYDRVSWVGSIAGYRIYNRVLTQDEISTLANEFTPTTA